MNATQLIKVLREVGPNEILRRMSEIAEEERALRVLLKAARQATSSPWRQHEKQEGRDGDGFS